MSVFLSYKSRGVTIGSTAGIRSLVGMQASSLSHSSHHKDLLNLNHLHIPNGVSRGQSLYKVVCGLVYHVHHVFRIKKKIEVDAMSN
jgi:hypothetical protein